MTIYSLFLVFIWFIFIAYWAFSALAAKSNANAGAWWRGMGLRALLVIIVIVAARTQFPDAISAYHPGIATHPILSGIGVILAALGIAFAIWARYHLGKNWGMPMTVKESPDLVTSGPYTFVRHPIYKGVILALIGTAMVVGGWWALLPLIYSLYFVYSARKEEAVMAREFPDQYPGYKARTKMIIPFIL